MRFQHPPLLRNACLIDGEWTQAANGAVLSVHNPATQEVIGTVPACGAAETEQAVAAAERALPSWRDLTGKARAAVLRRWADLVLAHQEDLAQLMTAEQGKPLAEARGEVAYAASFLEWFGEEAKRVDGDVLSSPRPSQKLLVLRQPVGVCAAITPWNFPAAMITRKAGPALAAGCTMIVKPAEQTPLTALALAALAEQAGVPHGVLQVVTGDPIEIGNVLCASPVVRKLSFTGSTAIGKLLMAQCAGTVKKLSLELGGNAPLIVFEDADLDRAVDGIMASKFRNSGQTCVCANRIYVHDAVYDEVASRLVQAVGALKAGHGIDSGVTQGPLIDGEAVAKVESHIADALLHGARVLTGGRRHALGGTFFEPTVLAHATAAMRVAREETFGPLAPLFHFRDEQDVIAMANDTESGLAAYFFSRNIGKVWRVAEALEYGMVGINTGLISNEVAPFGGVKQSGLGREGSRYGIDEYLEMKYLCLDLD
ncbi:NAD-dependent succinate-semialdehyde dehydrogenase [Cupriavidus consociatus]|uniref:NAD-dependent succinate-semialdehyde dehydrogenase n=1 Tax=Cupriavidus consociatus TaxID=2821357 RepID=UPI001AE94020|nr:MULTISPECIES: NAD-dependent succinate-semialdehyde dehydrogenase [unclassified Cupriavidus]MBP0624426.1 NAD-dependent succinate-semialdehyde dehydrogenase [Cupriavidus sp. LEh25]MDK2661138.1 NAD-dependent succinate-semialdehyde dehydrogenase [Cupriavidus sp. LEh21]